MPTLSPPISANGTKKPTATDPAGGLRVGGVARRRRWPRAGIGVVVVAGCALGFAATSLRVGGRAEVLELRHSLAAGTLLSASDLSVVRVSAPGVAVLPAAAEQAVVGRPAAVALVAGSLLTPAELGAPAGLPAGQAEVALAVKAGGYPPRLAAGEHVLVITAPTATASTGSGSAVAPLGPTPAVVLGVQPASASAATTATVITVRVGLAGAPALADASAAGQVSLILVGAGSGS